MSITFMTLTELSEAMKRGELSSREITEAYLARIQEAEGQIGGYITVDEEGALRQADEADRARAAGNVLSPLHGIPVAVKDNICVEGLPTT